jgi:formylglycine-generating enzyme required for sulfatase activity
MVFVPVPGTRVQFCIWETRVQDFEAFADATGYDATQGVFSLAQGGFVKDGHTWKNPGFEQGPTHPVAGASWNDAKAFCAWLTGKEHKAGLIQTNQAYRLPTDAEWSCAIGLSKEEGRTPALKQQGGERSVMAQARRERRERTWDGIFAKCDYPWGQNWPPPKDFGNYPQDLGVDTYPFTAPVGSFRANAVGLFDLSGNLWEWCEDLHTETGSSRVYRGGSFTRGMAQCFASWARASGEPNERYVSRGFRVVLTSAPDR